jgi:hypothetical protein
VVSASGECGRPSGRGEREWCVRPADMLQHIEREKAIKALRVCGRLHTCRTATPSLHACRSQGLQPHRAWQDLPGGGGWCCAPRDVRAGGQRSEPTRKRRLPRQRRARNRGAHGRHRCCTDPTATACACQHVADSPQCHLHSCCCCCLRSGELCASRWRCELGVHHLSASHYPLLQSRAFTSRSCFLFLCGSLLASPPQQWLAHSSRATGERRTRMLARAGTVDELFERKKVCKELTSCVLHLHKELCTSSFD